MSLSQDPSKGQRIPRKTAEDMDPGQDRADSCVDEFGEQLCKHALWGIRCRFQDRCSYSHNVPVKLLEEYRLKRQVEEADIKDRRDRELARPTDLPPPQSEEVEMARQEAIIDYDSSQFSLGCLVQSLLGCAEGEQLQDVHKRAVPLDRPPICPTLIHAWRLAGRHVPKCWARAMRGGQNSKHVRALHSSDAYIRWLEGYDSFVRVVILPLFQDPRGIYYQKPPTLRVVMPGKAASIGVHCDAEYPCHHPAEANIWVPLTPVGGSTALWLESGVNKGDFRPMPLEVGQFLRFNGNRCRHHTVANTTDCTRVSFDLRVVPASFVSEPPNRIGDYGVAFVQ